MKKEYCYQEKINYIAISYKEFNNINTILKNKLCV
jgi:hypothetical protein